MEIVNGIKYSFMLPKNVINVCVTKDYSTLHIKDIFIPLRICFRSYSHTNVEINIQNNARNNIIKMAITREKT